MERGGGGNLTNMKGNKEGVDMDPGDSDCGERLRRRRGLWKPSVSDLPSSAPDMSEAEEDDPDRDGDGDS